MREFINIVEYEMVDDLPEDFDKRDFTGFKPMWDLNTSIGIMNVVGNRYIDNGVTEMVIGTVFNNDLSDPISLLAFRVYQNNLIMLKNAWTSDMYRKKGILGSLFNKLMISSFSGNSIISDVQMTSDGEIFFNKLINSGKYTSGIYYFPTNEFFKLSDIGKQTSDGTTIIDPKDDNEYSYLVGEYEIGIGQKFFYFLK